MSAPDPTGPSTRRSIIVTFDLSDPLEDWTVDVGDVHPALALTVLEQAVEALDDHAGVVVTVRTVAGDLEEG